MELGPVCEGASRCIREWIWVQGGKALGFHSGSCPCDLRLLSLSWRVVAAGTGDDVDGVGRSWARAEKKAKKEQVCLPSEEGRIWLWSNWRRISEGMKSNILQPLGQWFIGFSFSPEPISVQDLDQFQMEPTDHNGLTHPEFQSLCQTPAPSV